MSIIINKYCPICGKTSSPKCARCLREGRIKPEIKTNYYIDYDYKSGSSLIILDELAIRIDDFTMARIREYRKSQRILTAIL